jgi:DNA-binding Lrp family transcriptional regulator
MKAFVMIKLGTTEYLGATRTILEEISKLPVVATAYAIFGRYDVIAEVEVKSLRALSNLIQDRLKAISGVQATETFICHE